ncbi:hypothetical protein LUQ84_001743 [Hamiltosporidium tvaerminnensis]|nr:hypothetical protein LUQ84_001743 [Hamiltosporidium tvaerminnensis]
MLLNSKLLKSLFDREKTTFRVFIKNISSSNFLLFLELVKKSNILTNQITIKAFLEILRIITILDIKKSKQRDLFIKELLRSLVYGLNTLSFGLYLNESYYNYLIHDTKRSLSRDLLVFFMELVYFKENRTKHYLVVKENKITCFKIEGSVFYQEKNKMLQRNKICLRLNDFNAKKLSKLMTSYLLRNIWVFLLKITRIDFIYFAFALEETLKSIFEIFSGAKLPSEKFYIHSIKNATKILLKMKNHIFLKNLKVLKFEFDFTLEE